MQLYVVIDTKGEGRVLGVFDDSALAESLAAQDPAYYTLHACRLNEVNPESLSWAADASRRSAIECIITRIGKRLAR